MGVKFRRFKFEGLEPDLPSGSFAWFHPAGSSSTSTKLSLHPPLHSHQYKLYSHAFEHPHLSVSSILQARRGGFASQGDRSAPHTQSDVFQGLRQRFFRLITDLRMDKQILSAFESKAEQEPFSSEQLQPFRRLVDEFLEAHGITPDWSVPSGQCIWLH